MTVLDASAASLPLMLGVIVTSSTSIDKLLSSVIAADSEFTETDSMLLIEVSSSIMLLLLISTESVGSFDLPFAVAVTLLLSSSTRSI